ncbi:MAG: bifunctional metallophosphatase/5'-nucleotidase [Gammaproteobacteria bacterium]|nr:bifunctional metallophosphatase/5'-nucleotidase [Gammaproteobacteria bacterium]
MTRARSTAHAPGRSGAGGPGQSRPLQSVAAGQRRCRGRVGQAGKRHPALADWPAGSPAGLLANPLARVLRAGAVGLLLVTAAPAVLGAALTVQILHVSDLEGEVSSIDNAPGFAATVQALREDARGRGWPSILLSAGDSFIPGPFFDAGNEARVTPAIRALTGLPSAQPGRGRADIALMNALGFDAATLGNHEFDAGNVVLRDAIAPVLRDENGDGRPDRASWLGASFPLLSANLDFRADPVLGPLATYELLSSDSYRLDPTRLDAAVDAPRIAPATVVEVDGAYIGVLGASPVNLDRITSPGETRVVHGADGDPLRALATVLQPTIDALLAAGIDKIVLLSHLQQIGNEQRLAPMLKGVDVIVAGGSNSILKDDDDRLRDTDQAVGTYPLVARSASDEPMLIVSTDGRYRYLGRLVVSFDEQGRILLDRLDPSVNGVYATDEQGLRTLWGDPSKAFADGSLGARVKALTDAMGTVIMDADREHFGKTAWYLEGRRGKVRREQTNLGDLIADAYLASARVADPGVRAAIVNAGGIRASIGRLRGDGTASSGGMLPPAANESTSKQRGEISRLDIENVLRFNNGLTLLSLRPAQLAAVLEHALAQSTQRNTPGRFAQVSGLAISYDLGRPAGSRIRDIAIKDDVGRSVDLVLQDGMLLGDPQRQIRIVTNRFLADGGDGYPFPEFQQAAAEQVSRLDLDNARAGQDSRSGFAAAGTEQDALATLLSDRYSATPLNHPELPPGLDARLQDLNERTGTVLSPPAPALQADPADAADTRAERQARVDLNLHVTARLALARPAEHTDGDAGQAGSIAFDATSGRLFVTRAEPPSLAIIQMGEDGGLRSAGEVELAPLYADRRTRIEPTSVATHGGLVAVSIKRLRVLDGRPRRGIVALFDISGRFVGDLEVGHGPVKLTFTPDGSRILVANEGEPSADYAHDPEGSVSIIDVSDYSGCVGDCVDQPVSGLQLGPQHYLEVDFRRFDPLKEHLRTRGVRIFGPTASVARDLEPAWIEVTADASSAWLSLQENNALARIDLYDAQVQELVPLGAKWWPQHGGLDASDEDGRINIQPWPVLGLYQPGAIAVSRIGPDTFVLTANQGRARANEAYDEQARVADLRLDPDSFPNAEALSHPQALGRLLVSRVDADSDGDGDIDRLLAFGGRSFSIWRSVAARTGQLPGQGVAAPGGLELVYDSGDALERLLASTQPAAFNAEAGQPGSQDRRSDDIGPAPVAIVVGEAFGRKLAFIALDGAGTIVVYDVSEPRHAYYVTHLSMPTPLPSADRATGDSRPRGMLFIPADGPGTATSRPPRLVVAFDGSGTLCVVDLQRRDLE